MPYQTPFDQMNEHYKTRTGSFKDRPSAPPSKIDQQIEAAAARFMERLQTMTNPANNVREVDRRSGQVAAQNQALMGARPEAGPTTSYSPTMIKEGISTAAQKAIAPVQGLMQRTRDDMARIQEQNAFNRVMGMRTSAEDPNFRGVNAQRAIDEGRTSGRSTPLININQPTGELKPPLSSVPQDLREFGKGVAADVGKLADWPGRINTGPKDTDVPTANQPTGELKGPPKAIKEGLSWFGREMGAGFGKIASDIKQDLGGTAEAGPYRQPASDMRHSPNQRTGMEPQLRTGPRPDGTITSPGAVDDKTTTRTPTDQGEQVGTQKAGTTFNGSTAPSTGNRYAEMIAAGPEAQAKFIKDANLIHMIRGTDQTWGNPKIQGDLGVKEFKSALEAAAGVDAPTALTQDEAAKDRATELEKQKIANQKGRFQPVTETDQVTGQQSTKMVDTLLNEEIGSGQELDEVQSAADAWHASDKGEQAQADLKAAIKRHAKMRQYLQFLVSPNAK